MINSQSVDEIIIAEWIVPVIPRNVVLEDHALVVKNGVIHDLLQKEEALQKYSGQITDLKNHLLIPGLINTHTHAPMSLLKGYADDLPLMEWLNNHIWPAEGKHICDEFISDGADIAFAEMIKSGTTCINDMYFFPELVAKRAINCGMRATVGLIVIDFPSAYANDADNYIAKGLDLHKELQDCALVKTAFAPHAPYTVSAKPLEKIVRLADDLDLKIHMHLHETSDEVKQFVKQHGQRPISKMKELGVFSSRLNAVHMTQLNNEEIDLVADHKVNVIHCPESNLKLASGFAPAAELISAGVNLSLGTDGSASNNDLDLLGEAKTAALIAKGRSLNAETVPAATALEMATINGARTLGIDKITGSLEIGKQADVVAINMSSINKKPVYNPVSQLIYCSNHDITTVWINGRKLLDNRQLTTLDETELSDKAMYWQKRISSDF